MTAPVLSREETIEIIMMTLTSDFYEKMDNDFNKTSHSNVMAVFKKYEKNPSFRKELTGNKFKSLVFQYVEHLDDLMTEFEKTNKRITETGMGSTELEYFYYLNHIDTLKMTYLEQLLQKI